MALGMRGLCVTCPALENYGGVTVGVAGGGVGGNPIDSEPVTVPQQRLPPAAVPEYVALMKPPLTVAVPVAEPLQGSVNLS